MKLRSYLLIIFSVIVLALFQTSFFAEVFGNSLNPNLVLVLVFAFLFMDKTQEALFTAFFGGLLLDALGVSVLGVSSLFCVATVLLTLFAKKFIQESKYFRGALFFGFFLLYSWTVNFNHFLMTSALLGGAFLTLILAYFLYIFMKNLGNETKYL